MGSIASHVQLTITADTLGVARAGFGILLVLSANALWTERVRAYTDTSDAVVDWPVSSPEYLAINAALSQSPHPVQVFVGRAVGQPTQKFRVDVSNVIASHLYSLKVLGQGVTATTCTYTTPAADLNITLVTNGADSFTAVAHGMSTGDGPYRYSTGTTLPTGLAVDTDYWVIKLTADTFSLASSKTLALATTAINITSDGVGTQTLRRVQNDVICAQFKQSLNAVVGKNFTAVQITGAGETDYLEITANIAGAWCSIESVEPQNLKIAQTHAEPGTALATDLDAIRVENDDWYGFVTLYNSDAYVKAAAAWTESKLKLYIAQLSGSDTVQLAVTGGDTADALHTLAYTRTATIYHPSPAAMLDSAWGGRMFPIDPGADDWKWQTIASVTPVALNATQEINLRAKKCNTLQSIAGRNITWEGTTVDGGFIDNKRGIDWIYDDMTKGVFTPLSSGKKIPFTNAGIALIASEVIASLKRAVAAGIITDDFVVTVPDVADISTNDKALRNLPNVKWSATLAGSVHTVHITGVVSV